MLLDAFALIAFARDEPAAADVERILRGPRPTITAINLAEVCDILQRVHGVTSAQVDALLGPLMSETLTVMAVDEPLARAAADVRGRRYHRTRAALSLADCVLLAAAGRDAETLATADRPLAAAARGEGIAVESLPDSRGRRA